MLLLGGLSANYSRSKFKLILSGGALFFLMGFKSANVGNDTANYISFFEHMRKLPNFFDPLSRFEMGYQVYNKLLGIVFKSTQSLFIVTAAICIGCVCYGVVRLSTNWQYSLFLFVGLRFYYFFLSGLRQSIALSIIIVSYVLFREKKYLGFCCLVLLATTFHFSAIIFFAILLVSKLKITRDTIIKFLMGTVTIYLLFAPIMQLALSHLPGYYSHYLLSEAGAANNVANYIYTLINIVFIVFAFSVDYIDKADTNDSCKCINGDRHTELILMFFSAGLSLIATRASIIDRMVQYFWIFSIFSISNILFSIKDKFARREWYFAITVLVILYNVVLLVFRPEWTEIIPYRFYWQD